MYHLLCNVSEHSCQVLPILLTWMRDFRWCVTRLVIDHLEMHKALQAFDNFASDVFGTFGVFRGEWGGGDDNEGRSLVAIRWPRQRRCVASNTIVTPRVSLWARLMHSTMREREDSVMRQHRPDSIPKFVHFLLEFQDRMVRQRRSPLVLRFQE